MVKYRSQSGISAAETYGTQGSVLDLDEINASQGVSFVDEMGGRVMSERMQQIMLREVTAALVASTDFNVTALGSSTVQSPDCPTRILAASVLIPAANATEIENWSLAVRDQNLSREVQLISWDIGVDDEIRTVWNDDGAGAADFIELRPKSHQLPGLMTRVGDLAVAPQVLWRGTSAAVVATTVVARLVVQLARPTRVDPQPGEPSSYGLPLPGW